MMKWNVWNIVDIFYITFLKKVRRWFFHFFASDNQWVT